jgi:DNA-binding GntR family transcriptional regulator
MRQQLMRREANRTPLLFIDRDGAKRGPGLGKSNLPSLPPAARYTLQEQAYLRLREALISGHFVTGQAITLRAAAEALGTSPMPVRDALRRLEIEHALVPRSNRTLGVPEMTYASLTECAK